MVSTASKKQKCDYISKVKETKRSKLNEHKYQVANELLAKVSDLSSIKLNFMSFNDTRTNQVVQEEHDCNMINMEYGSENRNLVSILICFMYFCSFLPYI